MSGGKGGSSTSSVTVPQYIEDAARRNLSRADDISKIGYTPYYGPDVAAFNPMQQSAFQNTANAASAFGMAGGGGTGMEGMPAPTTYAGGIQGYSSAPLYEESLAELGQQRPGQKDFIDSLFIDPYTGEDGSRVGQTVDYTQPVVDTGGGNGGGNNGGGGASDPVYTGPSDDYYNNEDTVMSNLGVGGANASFDSPSETGSYGGSLMTGEPSEANSSYFDSVNNGTRNEYGVSSPAVNFPNFDPSDFSSNYGSGPTPTGSTTPSPYSGGYTGFKDMFDGGGAGTSGDTFEGGISGVSNLVATPAGSENKSSSSGDGCVVATHAVNSGAFSPTTKREAVVWCMNVLHGKWWGEAIRRGYRHCGNKKIAQGKAREHYGEFRRYIDFANGKKRTVAGAVTFTLRTAQFFAVGLIKKDA